MIPGDLRIVIIRVWIAVKTKKKTCFTENRWALDISSALIINFELTSLHVYAHVATPKEDFSMVKMDHRAWTGWNMVTGNT